MKYIVVFLCIFNVLMWIIFLRKFSKLFSTDKIMESTREEYNKLIVDFNKTTEQSVTLLDERIKISKSLIKEIDAKIKMLMDMEKQGESLGQLRKSVNRMPRKKLNELEASGTLFDEPESEKAVVSSIPIVSPKVYVSETPIKPQKDFKKQAAEFYDLGMKIEDIADRLKCTSNEVQLALSLENRI